MSRRRTILLLFLGACGVAVRAQETRPGMRLHGHVLDELGRPLAGVGFAVGVAGAVVTADALHRPVGRSGADGRFDFVVARSGVASRGEMQMFAAAPGRAAMSWTWDAGPARGNSEEPFELRLGRGGSLKGHVWGPGGKPLAGVRVAATDALAEISFQGLNGPASCSVAYTGADGAFTLPCTLDAAITVRATADGYFTRTVRPVCAGDPVRFELEPGGFVAGRVVVLAEPPAEWRLVVRARDAITEAAIPRFRLNGSFRESDPDGALRLSNREPADRIGGIILFGDETRRVTVLAEGYAPCILPYREPEDGKDVLLEARLERESAIEGQVVDAVTGLPVAGAEVLAQKVAGGSSRDRGYATAGSDGRFRLGQLAAESYRVWTRRQSGQTGPESGRTVVQLARGETRRDLRLPLPAGWSLRSRLTGTRPAPDWRVRIACNNPRPEYSRWEGASFVLPGDGNRLGKDGSFRFDGLLGDYEVTLVIPAPPRTGNDFYVSRRVEIRGADWTQDLDVQGSLPGQVRGKVVLEGAPHSPGRLLVVAVDRQQDEGPSDFIPNCCSGQRTLVAADKSFELMLLPGEHRLHVFDVATGVMLQRSEARVTIQASQVAEQELQVMVVPVRVRLTGARDAARTARLGIEGSLGPRLDRGSITPLPGQDLIEAPEEVSFWVPPGDVRLVVSEQPWPVPVARAELGELSFTVTLGTPVLVTLPITAPASQPGR